MTNFDSEEQEILEAFEANRLKRSANWQAEIAQHQEIAAATFAQNQIINIPVSDKDLRSLQKRALAEGIPYSLYVSSILHKFLEGKLVEVS
ncbi:MAG: antitoxin [Oscillatoriales cyanobacterium CG2_30_44_21]|nr:MAG: antitoxin [Oscillatoriales cyanobacterium CG2_30_44_21]